MGAGRRRRRWRWPGLLATAWLAAGCGGAADGPGDESAAAGPAAGLLPEGAEAMIGVAGDYGGEITLWPPPEGGEPGLLPQGSRVRVVRDPGPESEPDRSVRVYSDALGRGGDVGRDELIPLGTGRGS